MVCSNPDDCAEIERRHSTGDGLLANGGASRGNLLSGDADHVLLTVSRISAEKKANPGYRAFFANGFNVTRLLVLVFWEVFLELTAAIRQAKRDVLPRGHRGVKYAFIRAGVCVFVRDLTVHAVISDMFKGRPAVYATFASYDEVAHHSGLERGDTLEALRKLDQQFGRIDRARRYAPRPYEIVVLSDHGQTQGATFKQRHGYGLDDLIRRSIDAKVAGGRRRGREPLGRRHRGRRGHRHRGAGAAKKKSKKDVSGEEVVVLGSGNLGLVYLMDEQRRMTLEEIDARHPKLIPALREHRARRLRARALGRRRRSCSGRAARAGSPTTASRARTRSRTSRRAPPSTCCRADGFKHCPDLYVNSFYDPDLDEGCAFEELISFHGGMGGLQTRPFILFPKSSCRSPTSRSSARPTCTSCSRAGGDLLENGGTRAGGRAGARRRRAGRRLSRVRVRRAARSGRRSARPSRRRPDSGPRSSGRARSGPGAGRRSSRARPRPSSPRPGCRSLSSTST